MNTAELKKFAQTARRELREQVAARLEQVLRTDSAALREKSAAVRELQEQIACTSKKAVIDRVAYTWFNRFCALRFMDVNHYTRMGVVSPTEGFTQPEILQEAKQGYIAEEIQRLVDTRTVLELLNGQRPSADPQGEAYRLLLVGMCNFYNTAMPFLFEKIADYTELLMPQDLLSDHSILHDLRAALTPDACQDVEVIGWLYQFYISERKDEIFDGLKRDRQIEVEDLPAATQLFTPHWIVRYLVENSLGRLWMLNRPDSHLIEEMDYYIRPEKSEEDFLQIASPEEIKICDPACGSGHMLTYAFELLYDIYEEEGYQTNEISRLILEKNLFGIEIDERAGNLAAFALVMKARNRDKRFFNWQIQPNICVLENITFTDQELKEYASDIGRDLFTEPLLQTLKQFKHANNFGSLIRPVVQNVHFLLLDLINKGVGRNIFLYEIHERVQKAIKQAEFLSQNYHVVVANPPYMGKGINDELKEFLDENYPDVKYDLFSAFIVRNTELAYPKGQLGFMAPFTWMFISTYEKLRNFLIQNKTFTSLIQLEYSGFEGAVVPICTFTLENRFNSKYRGAYIRLSSFKGSSIQAPKALEAIKNPQCGWMFRACATDFQKIPGSPVAYWISEQVRRAFENLPLSKITISDGQNVTGNNDRFVRQHWEIKRNTIGAGKKWVPYAKGGGFRRWQGNIDEVVNWSEEARNHYHKDPICRIIPEYLWYRRGITWGLITSSKPSFRLLPEGSTFDKGGSSVFFKDNKEIPYILGLLNSKVALYLLQVSNPTLNFQVKNIRDIPCIYSPEQPTVEKNVDSLVKNSLLDWNDQETAIEFTSLPLLEKRLGNFNTNLSSHYQQLRFQQKEIVGITQRLESENNRIFIDAYGLQDEMDPEVPISDISLTFNPGYRYGGNRSEAELETLLLTDTVREFISYAVGCMFGRYSLDKPGLILANQGETLTDYLRQVPDPTYQPDEDNVIPVLEGEWFSDDITERFKKFLRVTFGAEHYEENLAFIEQAIGRDVRSYFLKEFYAQHVKMYQKRPIYWMFSSPKGSFNVLVYMHRYKPDTISVILNKYLREFRGKLEARKAYLEGISISASAPAREKTAALKELDKLSKIMAELLDYERETLYPLAIQKMVIDLDDGVKANYPKFGSALAKISGL